MLRAHARALTSTSGRFGLYQALGLCSLQETPENGAEDKFRQPRTLPACSLRPVTTCKPRLLCLASRALKKRLHQSLDISCSLAALCHELLRIKHHVLEDLVAHTQPHMVRSSIETWDQAMKGGFVFGTSTRGILSSP